MYREESRVNDIGAMAILGIIGASVVAIALALILEKVTRR